MRLEAFASFLIILTTLGCIQKKKTTFFLFHAALFAYFTAEVKTAFATFSQTQPHLLHLLASKSNHNLFKVHLSRNCSQIFI